MNQISFVFERNEMKRNEKNQKKKKS